MSELIWTPEFEEAAAVAVEAAEHARICMRVMAQVCRKAERGRDEFLERMRQFAVAAWEDTQ